MSSNEQSSPRAAAGQNDRDSNSNSNGNGNERQLAPAPERNRLPILEVLKRVLPAQGLVLELASGTGEHATFFAAQLPSLLWQPSDPDARARRSIAAWIRHSGVTHVRAPVEIDACSAIWPVESAAAVVNINRVHISPWAAC